MGAPARNEPGMVRTLERLAGVVEGSGGRGSVPVVKS